jgi:hypothetical protein
MPATATTRFSHPRSLQSSPVLAPVAPGRRSPCAGCTTFPGEDMDGGWGRSSRSWRTCAPRSVFPCPRQPASQGGRRSRVSTCSAAARPPRTVPAAAAASRRKNGWMGPHKTLSHRHPPHRYQSLPNHRTRPPRVLVTRPRVAAVARASRARAVVPTAIKQRRTAAASARVPAVVAVTHPADHAAWSRNLSGRGLETTLQHKGAVPAVNPAALLPTPTIKTASAGAAWVPGVVKV